MSIAGAVRRAGGPVVLRFADGANKRPPKGIVTNLNPRSVLQSAPTHPLIGATVDSVHSALLRSELGEMSSYMDLLDDMRERDQRLDAVCRTRALALCGCDWDVKPAPGWERDDEAKMIAQEVKRQLSDMEDWSSSMALMMDGVFRPFSVLEIEWFQNARGFWAPYQLHWRHPGRFNVDAEQRLVKYDAGVDKFPGVQLEDLGRDRFVVHSAIGGRATYLSRRGLLRNCVFTSLTKRYGLRWLMIAAERFGQPAPVLRVDEADDDVRDLALAALRKLSTEWQMVIDKGMDLTSVPGSGAFTGEAHVRIVDMVNTEHAIQVLGQNLSTEVKGGSYAAAAAHESVRFDFLTADARETAATIRRDLLEPIVRYNWPGAPVPSYEWRLTKDEQREPQEWHFMAGVVSRNEIREYLGRSAIDDGTDGGGYMPGRETNGARDDSERENDTGRTDDARRDEAL